MYRVRSSFNFCRIAHTARRAPPLATQRSQTTPPPRRLSPSHARPPLPLHPPPRGHLPVTQSCGSLPTTAPLRPLHSPVFVRPPPSRRPPSHRRTRDCARSIETTHLCVIIPITSIIINTNTTMLATSSQAPAHCTCLRLAVAFSNLPIILANAWKQCRRMWHRCVIFSRKLDRRWLHISSFDFGVHV